LEGLAEDQGREKRRIKINAEFAEDTEIAEKGRINTEGTVKEHRGKRKPAP